MKIIEIQKIHSKLAKETHIISLRTFSTHSALALLLQLPHSMPPLVMAFV